MPDGASDSLLPHAEWERTAFILPHGPLAAGYLTGRFDCTSVSSAASTGIMDLRSERWCEAMLDAIAEPDLPQTRGQVPAGDHRHERAHWHAGRARGTRCWATGRRTAAGLSHAR